MNLAPTSWEETFSSPVLWIAVVVLALTIALPQILQKVFIHKQITDIGDKARPCVFIFYLILVFGSGAWVVSAAHGLNIAAAIRVKNSEVLSVTVEQGGWDYFQALAICSAVTILAVVLLQCLEMRHKEKTRGNLMDLLRDVNASLDPKSRVSILRKIIHEGGK